MPTHPAPQNDLNCASRPLAASAEPAKTEQSFTPGPWAWFGEGSTQSLYLATERGGRRFVMQFARWGMNQAQPRFQVNSRMVDASTLLQFEVCKAVGLDAAKQDPDCYRLTIAGIDHPDARLISAAPDLYEALIELRAAVDEFVTSDIDMPSHDESERRYVAAFAKAGAALAKAKGA